MSVGEWKTLVERVVISLFIGFEGGVYRRVLDHRRTPRLTGTPRGVEDQ